MTTFNTGNPLGSTDVYDRYDNSENLDNFSNGPLDAYPDRFGVMRQSLQGIRNASQYQVIGAYAAGLQITAQNQVFSYLGEFYAPGPAIVLPYTTTGIGAAEIANFRSVGDAVLRADLANDTDPAKGAWLVGLKHGGKVSDAIPSVVVASDGGDMTAKLQTAIDTCLSVGATGTALRLQISGVCKISSSLYIDRPVDQSKSEFIIEFIGDGGITSDNNELLFFSSRLVPAANATYGTLPSSEWVTFKNGNFSSPLAGQENCVIDGTRLFRIKFDGCYFRRVKGVKSSSFLQSYYFNMCQARQWVGYFVDSTGLFDVHVDQCQFEEAIATVGWGFNGSVFPACSFSFTNSVYEGTSGYLLVSPGVQGAMIAGNYFEYNIGTLVDLLGGDCSGFAWIGNRTESAPANLANPEFWEIVIGNCSGLSSSGNHFNGRGMDFRLGTANAVVGMGDHAGIQLYRGGVTASLGGFNNAPTRIAFPATPSPVNDSTTLDEYREGQFRFYIGQTGTALEFAEAAGVATGYFVKVGRLVTCFFDYRWTSRGTTNPSFFAAAGGLPYPVVSGTYRASAAAELCESGGNTSRWFISPVPGTSEAVIRRDGLDADLLCGDLPAAGRVSGSFSYLAQL